MVSSITSAIFQGYPSRLILDQLIKKYPQHAGKIEAAQAVGYSADRILKKLDNSKDTGDDADQYLTEHEQVKKRDKQQKRKAAMQVVGALGTAGAIASGVYALANRNRPSISRGPPQQGQLPGPGQAGGGPLRGGGLPGPGTRPGLGYNPQAPQNPQQPPPQVPQGPSPQPPQTPQPTINRGGGNTYNAPTPRDPMQVVNVLTNIGEADRVTNILQGVPDVATAVQVLNKILPKGKLALLDKMEGGLEQVIQDYAQHLQANPPAVREQFIPRNPQQSPQQEQPQEQMQPEQAQQQAAPQAQQMPEQQLQAEQPSEPINERVSQAAEQSPFRQEQQTPEMRRKSFYVPNYRYPGEDPKEFADRKILYSLINKGAKALMEGKSFLDFPVNKEAIKSRGGYSTAKDVLMFMGNIPNVYDPLLDDEEKDELMEGLLESGKMTIPGLAPTKGDRAIHGATLAPNLVWNLLLSIEPKLATMEKPPSVKGYKMAPGKKMGTPELRRFLTHSVYGVLSGRTVSSELSDKISRISKATSHLDAIVKAAHEGNMRRMDEEMERLMDDNYFMEVMAQDVEEMLKSPERIEEEEKLAKEDTKTAAAFKATQTRKKKKQSIETNED